MLECTIIFGHHDRLRAPAPFLGRGRLPGRQAASDCIPSVAANQLNEILPAAMIVPGGHNAPK